MRDFDRGKIAALEGIAEMIDNGFSFDEISDDINETIGEGLRKNASKEDVEWMSGAESAMNDFIKQAKLLSRNTDEGSLAFAAFEKIATSINLDEEDGGDVYSDYEALDGSEEEDEEDDLSIQEIHERLKTAGYIDRD